MQKTKDLDYYLALPYSIKITPILAEDGGGYDVTIPELGSDALCSCGDTAAEALYRIRKLQVEILGEWLEKGIEIPEPWSYDRWRDRLAE